MCESDERTDINHFDQFVYLLTIIYHVNCPLMQILRKNAQ